MTSGPAITMNPKTNNESEVIRDIWKEAKRSSIRMKERAVIAPSTATAKAQPIRTPSSEVIPKQRNNMTLRIKRGEIVR